MKILVTGGSGFLGGRVGHHLAQAGHDVLLGTRRDVRSEAHSNKHARMVRTPWNDIDELENICTCVDVIIHASGMNAKDCELDPVGALAVNTVATASILQAAIRKQVRRFIYVSTVHVYTDSLQGTISERNYPSNLHPYATSNRAAEDVVLFAQKNKSIDGVVIRLSNGFGVPIRRAVNCWPLLVNNLCRQAVERQRMVLASDGYQARNFISMQEICSVLEFLACRLPLQRNVGDVGPINVGAKSSQTVLEMAKLVQSRCKVVLGFSPELITGPSSGLNQALTLDFQIERFLSLGYDYLHEPVEEIDNLLLYCRNVFSGFS